MIKIKKLLLRNKKEFLTMKKEQINSLYEENKNMIYKKSLSFHRTTGLRFEDLLSESNGLFMKAIKTFDEKKKAKFSSWLWIILTNGLNSYSKKTDLPNQDPDTFILVDFKKERDPVACLILKEKIENLSESAKEVASILLSCPVEILELSGLETPKKIRSKIKQYLRNDGWTWEMIYNSFREIKQSFC